MKHVIAGLFAFLVVSGAQAESFLGPMGGHGGGWFRARCPVGQLLAGFEVRTGDDIDAIRPLCVSAYGPTYISSVVLTGGLLERRPWSPDRLVPASVANHEPWHGGGGGYVNHVLCPLERPIVSGMRTLAGGENTIVIFNIALSCNHATANVPSGSGFGVIFDAKGINREGGGKEVRKPNQLQQQQGCPRGQIAVGIEGRSGIWLDAVGLICAEPTIVAAPPTTVPSIGKVKVPQQTSTEISRTARSPAVSKPGMSDSATKTGASSQLSSRQP